MLPSQSVPYPGFKCDSCLQALCLLPCMKEKFINYPGSVYLYLWRLRAPGYLRTRSTWPSRALHVPLGHSPCQSLCAVKLYPDFSSSPGLIFSLGDRSDTTNFSCTPMPNLMPGAAFWTVAEFLFLLLIIGLTKSCRPTLPSKKPWRSQKRYSLLLTPLRTPGSTFSSTVLC